MRKTNKGILHELQNYNPEPDEIVLDRDWCDEGREWLDKHLKEIFKPTFPMRVYYKGRWYILREEGGEWEEYEPEE